MFLQVRKNICFCKEPGTKDLQFGSTMVWSPPIVTLNVKLSVFWKYYGEDGTPAAACPENYDAKWKLHQ